MGPIGRMMDNAEIQNVWEANSRFTARAAPGPRIEETLFDLLDILIDAR